MQGDSTEPLSQERGEKQQSTARRRDWRRPAGSNECAMWSGLLTALDADKRNVYKKEDREDDQRRDVSELIDWKYGREQDR